MRAVQLLRAGGASAAAVGDGGVAVDPGRIYLVGCSAGGVVALGAAALHARLREELRGETSGGFDVVAAASGRPDAIALIYPMVSLRLWADAEGGSAEPPPRPPLPLTPQVG